LEILLVKHSYPLHLFSNVSVLQCSNTVSDYFLLMSHILRVVVFTY